MTKQYATEYNAIRGFRRSFAHLANLDNDTIRMDMVNADQDGFKVSLEAVADYEADQFGVSKVQRIEGVPMLRRSIIRKGTVARVREFFARLPAGTTRKAAIAAAVEAGFAYATARTQYQIVFAGA